jgi:endonuclease/exonuclease/phosphatase family metal-dependent hydrolase
MPGGPAEGKTGIAIRLPTAAPARHRSRMRVVGIALLCLRALVLEAKPFTIVACNVENLFDADGRALYQDYRPDHYTRAHLATKLRTAAHVIARYDDGRGPDVLILSELEVDETPALSPPDYPAIARRYARLTLKDMLGAQFDETIRDLPAEALLAKAFAEAGLPEYRIVVADHRFDVTGRRRLAHKNAVFTRLPVVASREHPTKDARAILEVTLDVDGASLHVFANHWKSGASSRGTEAARRANARTLRGRLDEILGDDPDADIVLGGDFNSHYNQRDRLGGDGSAGLNDILGSQGDEAATGDGRRELYNLWYELRPEQRGSDTYRGEWGTLMHLIVSRGLYDYRGVQYLDNSFAVGIFPGLNVDAADRPERWRFAGVDGTGFSDHFPVSARFVTVADGRTDRRLELRHPSREDRADTMVRKVDYAGMDLERMALGGADLPGGAALRSEAYRGRLFLVEGPAMRERTRLLVTFRGANFEIWSYDPRFRSELRRRYPPGTRLRFYGELDRYRGRWQFVIQDPSWIRPTAP